MPDAVILDFRSATFDTLCEGRLVQRLKRALAQVADSFEDQDLQEGRSELDAKITIELSLEHKIGSGATHLSATVKAKLPDLRAVSGTAILRDGQFLVEPNRQVDLPLTAPRSERS